MKRVVQYPTHYELEDYRARELGNLEDNLSAIARSPQGFQYKTRVGCFYDKERKILYVPNGYPQSYLYHYTKITPVNPGIYDSYQSISIRCTATPRNPLQVEMVQFLIGEGDYVANKAYSQLCCNAETGEGKTFAAIATQTYMRCKMIVIVNRSNIATNWMKETLKFTDMDEKRLLLLNTELCKKIIDGKLMVEEYFSFFVLQQTIRAVATTEGYSWKDIGDLFRKLGVGLKVYDESNMEFRNTMMIDFYTNTAKTLYLTATMKRSDMTENTVFQKVFKAVPKFDQYALGFDQSKKHIVYLLIKYNSNPSVYWRTACANKKFGFNSKKHSDYQITEDHEFYSIIMELLGKYSIGKDFRTLLLVSKIDSCIHIARTLRETFPNKKIGIYNSKVPAKEKARVLKEDDIIVSITKSLGFSETIQNLRMVINCEAFRFDGTGDQASGRLRRLPNNETCLYVELEDMGFPNITRQVSQRLRFYKQLFLKMIYIQR